MQQKSLLRRSNFYINVHSHSRKCVENFLRCAQREREIVERISRGTHENGERTCIATSKMTVPRQTNTQTYTDIETHILAYKRRIHSERRAALLQRVVRDGSRARRRWRSEINYRISGGRAGSGNVPQRLQHLVKGLARLMSWTTELEILASGLSYLFTCSRLKKDEL